jgi:uncharacterized phage protein gp47/JayE
MYDDETSDNIQTELLSEASDTYNKTTGSFLWDILKTVAIKIASLYTDLSSVSDKFDVDNLTGDNLDTYIEQHSGLKRKDATNAIGTLTVTGTGTISIGDLFETEAGIQFEATEEVTITTGGDVAIEAVESGDGGNVVADTITYIPVTISGITSVTNASATYDGFDEEDDDTLRARYLEYIQTPSTSGNAAQYKVWAKEISGVGGAKIIPLWNGNNTVKIVIIDSDMQPASDEIVANVQEYIDPDSEGLGEGEAPIGAYCTVTSADTLDITINVTITLNSAYSIDDVKTNIQTNIDTYLSSIAFSGGYVSYAYIGSKILATDGVDDYSDLLVNTGTSNVDIGDYEVPLLTTLTVTEED